MSSRLTQGQCLFNSQNLNNSSTVPGFDQKNNDDTILNATNRSFFWKRFRKDENKNKIKKIISTLIIYETRHKSPWLLYYIDKVKSMIEITYLVPHYEPILIIATTTT